MKARTPLLSLLAIFGFAFSSQAQLSGTKTVGPTGDYATLTAAIADVQAQGVNGALILELQPAYTSAGETFPLTFTNLTGASAVNTITVRPASGAAGLAITSADAVATVNLDNAQFVTFDGRPGGAGTAKELTIENTNTAGVALRLVNEASSNTVKYVALKGVTASAASGVVLFGTTTGANGNDNNTIDHCDIRDGATTPAHGVYSAGSSTTTEQNNSGNTVSGSNIFNFYSATAQAAGVRLDGGNTDWTITGNSFYQTATRTSVAPGHRAIRVNNAAGNNFTVTDNFIGGSEPNAGGTAWTTSGTATYSFQGIILTVGTTTPSSVQGNTIKNFVWNTGSPASSLGGAWVGIYVFGGGSVNIGTTTGNTIGSATGTGSISVTTSGANGTTFGIAADGSGTRVISNNTIGSIATNISAFNISTSFYGIQVTAGTNTISGNTIGPGTSAGSISVTTGNNGSALGIGAFSSETVAITNNTVASIAVNALPFDTVVSAIGISAGNSTGNYTISRNLVHSLSVSSGNASNCLGMSLSSSATLTAQNNVVRLGLDASGNSTAGSSNVIGISGGSGNFFHNSVYLGGTQTGSSQPTYAFRSTVTTARTIQNNIFVNARTAGGGLGKHYAVLYGGTTASPAGLTAGGNIFFVSGTNGVLGSYNGADRATLAAWQSATGQDTSSQFIDPMFVNPTGDAAAFDLHLQPNNPAEMGGLPGTPVTEDFDGETRSALTPTDIGADAGNFTSTTGDIYAPAITFTPVSPQPTTTVVTLTATIADNSGTVSGGASGPRLFFKKSSDADVFDVPNDASGNGWKYVAAIHNAGSYSFTFDYSLLNGGGVAGGDSIQYFVVVQDAANNLGSNAAGAAASANPPVQNINAHGGVNSYLILGTLSGNKTVGAGGDYPTLTGAGGVFETINNSIVTGDLVFKIIGDLSEGSAPNALNQLTMDDPNAAYTVTIQPVDGTMKTISGTANNPVIRLSGADRVTIDGRFNGGGRFLTIRNGAGQGQSSNRAILLLGDASNNTIRNCVLQASSGINTNGVVSLTTGVATGNDNNLFTENQIRSSGSGSGSTTDIAQQLFYSSGTAAFPNSNNTLSNNELINFSATAINISATGNEAWTISGNAIYQTASRTGGLTGISCSAAGTNTISGNSIRDLRTTTSAATGITIGGSGTSNVVNNQIALIPPTLNAVVRGIVDLGASGSTVNVFYNSVLLGGTASGSLSTWASQRSTTSSSAHTSRNNIFFNNRTGGTGSHFAAGNQSTAGSYSSDYNLFVGTGATAANFFDSGTSTTGTPVPFAQWKTATGGDTHSNAANPDATYSTTLFVDPASTVGDLHINTTASAATLALVENAGTPVSGVTLDFDLGLRSATTPDIGADEIGATGNTAPTITAATGLSRQQGTAASNSTIATVSDNQSTAGSLTVTATTVPPGISVTDIVNTDGAITAVLAADCSAAPGDNTVVLRVSDGALTTTDNLTVNVTLNTAPALTYDNVSVSQDASTTNSPTAVSDNGTITSFGVQDQGTYTGAVSVDNAGVVSISNAAPAGTHAITIRATDHCGATADATFTLTVNAPPSFAIDDITKIEGNSGPTAYTFTVTKTGATSLTASVNFATADGTATAPGDYAAASGTLNFAPGDTTKEITVNVNGDTTLESNEAFTVELTNAANATIADASGTGTIENDDHAPVADKKVVATDENDPETISLSATDADNDPLTFEIIDGPEHGSLSGIASSNCEMGSCTATVTYTPSANYDGPDSFTYKASDGTNDSAPATVTITVNEVVPVVINTNDSGPGSLRQAVLDSQDGDTIEFEIPGSDPGCSAGVCRITLVTPVSIATDVTLDGPTTGSSVTVSGGGATRVFDIAVGTTAILSHLTVANGFSTSDGGGIQNSGELTIANSTLAGNTAAGGGGAIRNDGALRILNSTLTDNEAGLDGGAIVSGSGRSVTLGNVTLVKNHAAGNGGGVSSAGTVAIRNSIIALNTAVTGSNIFNDGTGTVTSGGYNLSDDYGGGFLIATGDQINTDPILGPSKNNGGPTETHAPLSNSPAIDRGKNMDASAEDQRGNVRTVIYNDASIVPPAEGDRSDIGAVELAPGVLPLSTVSRKAHGAAGNFDIDLPSHGPVGIECRSGGTTMDYQLVVTFASSVTFTGAAVTSGSGSVATASLTAAEPNGEGNQVTINLTGVANAQRLTVALFEMNNGTNSGDVGIRVGMVLGDTNHSTTVNASDISETKAQSGKPVTASNFRSDVTANGAITSSDISLVKAQSGDDLPPVPTAP